MPRGPKNRPLYVYMNGLAVGVLTRSSAGAIAFSYSEDWLAWQHAMPVSLSLPLREAQYIGEPVVNVFDNLLPDTTSLRRRVAERIGADGTDTYSMLSALGRDCVGALQLLPQGEFPESVGSTNGKPVDDAAIARILKNLASTPLGLDDDDEFRISMAGAQEKTALLQKGKHWYKPTGTTATTHILKPQIGQLPNGIDLSNSVENEYLCLRYLQAVGVPTAQAEVASFDGVTVLVVERFDRRWTRDGRLLRVPQEDLCQALSVPSTLKYQSEGGPDLIRIIRLLQGSDDPDADIARFLRAVICFWLIGATDGHAKNFSIFLLPGGRFHLTPLYDVLTAQPSLDASQITRRQFRLAMSVGDSHHYRVSDVMLRHFFQLAKRAGVAESVVSEILDELADVAIPAYDRLVDSLGPLPEQLLESVRGGIERRLGLLAT